MYRKKQASSKNQGTSSSETAPPPPLLRQPDRYSKHLAGCSLFWGCHFQLDFVLSRSESLFSHPPSLSSSFSCSNSRAVASIFPFLPLPPSLSLSLSLSLSRLIPLLFHLASSIPRHEKEHRHPVPSQDTYRVTFLGSGQSEHYAIEVSSICGLQLY
jgi:hypothetical protein